MCTLLFTTCMISTMLLSKKVEAQSGCSSALMGLAPCLGYITGSALTPGNSCCTQLQSVVKTQASCLCQVLNGSGASSFGVNINQTQALQLPGACKVATPPISQCKAAGTPGAASPAGAPTASPTDALSPEAKSVTPDGSTTPTVSSVPTTGSGSGSKSTTGSTSTGNMNKFEMQSNLLLLVFASTIFAIIS
ncbi:hypothetical protein vseg_016998 [Gypsophila vaccaria]